MSDCKHHVSFEAGCTLCRIAELETKLEKLTKASQDVVDSYNEEKKTGSVSKLKALSKLLATYTST